MFLPPVARGRVRRRERDHGCLRVSISQIVGVCDFCSAWFRFRFIQALEAHLIYTYLYAL